jgi:hypothetical protein
VILIIRIIVKNTLGIRIFSGNTMQGMKMATLRAPAYFSRGRLSPSPGNWGPQLNLHLHVL